MPSDEQAGQQQMQEKHAPGSQEASNLGLTKEDADLADKAVDPRPPQKSAKGKSPSSNPRWKSIVYLLPNVTTAPFYTIFSFAPP